MTTYKVMVDDTREKYINPYTDFGQAEIAKYSDAERRLYEASQKEYWDYTSTLETAERKGEMKGVQKEKNETIHRLQAMGLSVEQIAQGAGMEVEEVKKLLP